MTLTIEPTASIGDLVSLAIALVALVFSIVALHRSDRTSSAGTLVSIYDSIGGAWDRFLNASTEAKQNFELAELLNRLEVACAMSLGQGIHGAAKELLDEYVESSLLAIASDDAGALSLHRMRDQPTTFKYILRFVRRRSRRARMAHVRRLLAGDENDVETHSG